jgi:hypothetical protein
MNFAVINAEKITVVLAITATAATTFPTTAIYNNPCKNRHLIARIIATTFTTLLSMPQQLCMNFAVINAAKITVALAIIATAATTFPTTAIYNNSCKSSHIIARITATTFTT